MTLLLLEMKIKKSSGILTAASEINILFS